MTDQHVPDEIALLEAVDAAMDGIAILDPDGRYVYVNEEHARLYGYDDPGDLEGESWQRLYGDEELDRFEREVLPRVTEDGRWRGEAVGRRRDGSSFDQELSLGLLDDGRMICTVRDISDRKRRERQLALLNDATHDLLYASTETEVAEIGVGIAEEVLGHSLTACWSYDAEADRLVPVATTDTVERMMAETQFEAVPGLGPDSYEMEVFESGEPTVVEDYQALEHQAAEAPLRTILMLPLGEHGVLHVGSTEVTEVSEPERTLMEILARNVEAALDRAERERGLKRRQARLERQNERLERLSNTLSHDLRNPLQVARSHLELLDDAVQSGRIDDIERMLDRMDQLIDDAMSLARTDGDVGGTEPVSLTAVAEEACAGVETGTADVTVHEMATVQADRSRLLELFENLLRNAVEHGSPSPDSRGQQDTVEGIRGVTVEIGPLEDGFYIADDGRGIPESEREAVFEYGYSTADDGTGFGLSIVREIAESHGWTVSVTGSEAGGARFEITGVESTGR